MSEVEKTGEEVARSETPTSRATFYDFTARMSKWNHAAARNLVIYNLLSAGCELLLIDVEDIAHEALLRFLRLPSDYEKPERLIPRIIQFEVKDAIRASSRRAKYHDRFANEPEANECDSPLEALIRKEQLAISASALSSALNQLTEEERTILALKDTGDMTYAQLSQRLHVLEETLRVRVSRIRRKHILMAAKFFKNSQ